LRSVKGRLERMASAAHAARPAQGGGADPVRPLRKIAMILAALTPLLAVRLLSASSRAASVRACGSGSAPPSGASSSGRASEA
jgi:hypothetical protein